MTTHASPPTPTPPRAKNRRERTRRRPPRLIALTSWDLTREAELADYLSERLTRGEALVALHGPPPISPVLVELGWETERGLDSGLVRALASANVPALEVGIEDRKAGRRAAQAGCVAVISSTRLLESSPGQPLGPTLEDALSHLAPRALVEVVIERERLLARPGLEALSMTALGAGRPRGGLPGPGAALGPARPRGRRGPGPDRLSPQPPHWPSDQGHPTT